MNTAPSLDLSIPSLPLGRVVVFAGPSGVGKGTILRSLLTTHSELHLSISATTRMPRPGEKDGEHYYFLTRSLFEEWITQGKLLEWAEYAGHYYGTPRQPVIDQLNHGKIVILEIELEGARQVRKTFPDALQIFILPPSFAALEQRLKNRSQDSPEAIVKRLERAQIELAAAEEFDLQIINDSLEEAIEALRRILFPL